MKLKTSLFLSLITTAVSFSSSLYAAPNPVVKAIDVTYEVQEFFEINFVEPRIELNDLAPAGLTYTIKSNFPWDLSVRLGQLTHETVAGTELTSSPIEIKRRIDTAYTPVPMDAAVKIVESQTPGISNLNLDIRTRAPVGATAGKYLGQLTFTLTPKS